MHKQNRQRFQSKDSVGYWRTRIYKPIYTHDGGAQQSKNWSVQIQCHGQRQTLSLGTTNRETAASKAQRIYIDVRAHGWVQALGKPQPEQTKRKANATVGEFFDELAQKADLEPKTLESYARAFRTILADAFKIDGTGKHASRGLASKEWLERIHAIKLEDITPQRIQEWKRMFLARAAGDPLTLRSAKVSVNSFMRRAKCLFSKKNVRHLDIILPAELPFNEVEFEKKQNVRYRSGFDVFALLNKARNELALNDPEGFKILLLALTTGLRAHEIDLLEWDSFDFMAGTLTIQPTRYYQPKSEYSLGTIDLEPELVEIFRGLRARAPSNFVIVSPLQPKTTVRYDYYRCRPHFDRLYAWLRVHGVNDRKPLHTLRKEYGSQVCDRHGIYAASRALRHASVAVTAAHYVDKKSKVTSGLGAAFSDKIVEMEPTQERSI
jgi:integrase